MIRLLEGRWKLVILFQLFGSSIRWFSELERAIPDISQNMLIQQLRRLEADGHDPSMTPSVLALLPRCILAANLFSIVRLLIAYFLAQNKLIGGIASVGLKG